MGFRRQVGQRFPQHGTSVCSGAVGQPQERHVWTSDETTDLTMCALSLPRRMRGLDIARETRCLCAPARHQGRPASTVSRRRRKSIQQRARQIFKASRVVAERGLPPTHAKVASIVSRVAAEHRSFVSTRAPKKPHQQRHPSCGRWAFPIIFLSIRPSIIPNASPTFSARTCTTSALADPTAVPARL